MAVTGSGAHGHQGRKAVPASGLNGGFSSPLPPGAKIIRSTTNTSDSSHPSFAYAKAVADSVKEAKRSKRSAEHAAYLRMSATSRSPRAGYVTTTFNQHSGNPFADPRAIAAKKAAVPSKRTCKVCRRRKEIDAFPAGQREGTRSTVCGKCSKKAAS